MKLTWKIGGEAGFGIMVSGLTMSKTLSRAGYHILEINEYPSLIRGGHNIVAITFSSQPVLASSLTVDILVALNKQTIDLHKNELTAGGIIIYDGESDIYQDVNLAQEKLISVPFKTLAKTIGGDMLMRNTVALGATLSLLGLDFSILEIVLQDQFQRKGEKIVKLNIDAASAGYEFIQKNNLYNKIHSAPLANSQEIVLTGAEAIGLGAIAAGMKFFAAYPMTPINGLINYFASVQQEAGIIYKQPEDEIAAINMTIGASFAGVRSMTATSGGGFSLMVEGTSLAGMIEQPVVIVMGMRPGPATGLPTWTGQADLHFILNASQGEFPRLILAPGDVTEAFYLTCEAFNLADKYQTPTFILVDKYLCESRASCAIFDPGRIQVDRGKLLSEAEQNLVKDLPRYKLTQDGISPRGIPGRLGGIFRANSDEHDEYGYSNEEAENTFNMISKRIKKQSLADKNAPEAILYGEQNADITLVGWGSTKGPALEALDIVHKNLNKSINFLHINYINPFPTEAILRILKKAKKVIDVEGNANAQMAQYIRLKSGIDITDKILKYNGRPFYPDDIVEGVKKYV